MLAKFSVRKPFTVLVAVVLVIVLGIVAFTKMTPDLLPSIDLPYVVIVTTYAGATPEEVESSVTKPLEQQMATLDNIKNVTSTSAENYCLIMLEFSDGADMDTISGDIREKISQVSGDWSDYVGTPYILKINPDMLPVTVAAVSRTGMDNEQLSSFINSELMNRLEGIEGVASISTSGMLESSVNVILDADKIAAVNAEIRAAIDARMSDARGEIESGLSQVASGESAITAGKQEIAARQQQLSEQLAAARQQLDDSNIQLITTKLDLLQQMSDIDDQLAGLCAVEQLMSAYDAATAAMEQMVTATMTAQSIDRAAATAYLQANDVAYQTLESQSAQLLAQFNALGTGFTAANWSAEVAAARTQLNTAYAALDAALSQLEAQQITLNQAQVTLQVQQSQAGLQMSSALSSLLINSQTLSDTRAQLESALDSLDGSAADAYAAADVSTVLTMSTVAQILQAQNFSMPAGYISDGDSEYLVRVGDKFSDAESLEQLVLFDPGLDGVEPVRLGDVAAVFVSDNAESIYAKINGEDGVMLSFSKQSDYATAVTSQNIADKFAALTEEYEGLKFTVLMDQGEYIRMIVNSVLQNLAVGAVLAIIILLLFLRDLRPTLITALSIPISVTFAIVLMYFSGVTLNMISLSGLAVGVGMLVDNSIVVIENIYRLRSLGVSRYRAAVSGAVQVAGAITASTLTTVCVFAPIVFVQGLTRQLFTDMALTITYALLASLAVALTLVPTAGSLLITRTSERAQKSFVSMQKSYRRAAEWALDHKLAVIAGAVLLLAVCAAAELSRGFTYMPDVQSAQIMVSLKTDDDTPLEQTAATSDTLSERIREIDGVNTVGAMLSGGMTSMFGLSGAQSATQNEVTMYVLLDDDAGLSSSQAVQSIERAAAGLDCEIEVSGSSTMSSYATALGGSGVQVELYGDDLDAMQTTSDEISALLADVEGVGELSSTAENATPVVRVSVDKDAAMSEGLTVAQVYMQLSAALTTESDATTLSLSDVSLDIVVGSDEQSRLTLDELRNYTFSVTGADGTARSVRLGDIAAVSESSTLSAIRRDNQRRQTTITAAVAPGYNVTLVSSAVEKALAGYELPAGFTLELAGESSTIMDSLGDLMSMMLLGVAFVYLIMVAQFQSLVSPLIVMFTIPLAFTGGLLALLVCGLEVSVIAMIGFIMLVGIIVNNGIVLVDCANRLQTEQGLARREAVIEAGATRLRPVLMTALTTVLGLLPLALGFGLGSDLIQPVAIVCIGGLCYATLMTLFVVPTMYDLLLRRAPHSVSDAELEISDL